MSADVGQVLSERAARGRGRRAEGVSFLIALLLHAVLLALALLLPRLSPPPKPLEFVPVQIIPAQALGVRRPAPPRRRSAPAPAPEEKRPEAPAPTPTPAPRPVDDVPVLPKEPDNKDKKKEEPRPQAPAPPERTAAETARPEPSRQETARPTSGQDEEGPSGTAPGETGDQLGRRGGPRGNPLGTTAFGSEIGGLDNPDFTYGYYLDRMLSLIDAQWVRPSMGSGVTTILSFRVHRDGSLSDLEVAQSSGYNAFDLAAYRAVQNAAPFPPLPRAYRHDSLGVRLIVR